jgi:putative ABC transport system permease protein
MKLKDIVSLSLNNLSHRGLRSWLTILGIVVGIAAVVSIISISSGMQNTISSQLGGLGADLITVSSGSDRATGMYFGGGSGGERTTTTTTKTQNLTIRDVQNIKSVDGVKYVSGIISGRASMTYMASSSTVTINGVDPLVWKDIITSTLESGRFLTSSDTNAIVIGNRVANNVFKQALALNTQVTIEGQTFKVVGIMAASGGMGGSDNIVYMPSGVSRTVVDGVLENQFSSITIKVSDVDNVDQVVTNITQKLIISRHVTNSTKDFTVTSSKQMQETMSSVMSTMNIFLTGIAAISLLVGAIGIANTMFTSVMERTKQIGTIKALGATNFEIMKLFLFESAMIGLIGGLIGVFLGFIGSGIISELGIRMMGSSARSGTTLTVIQPQLVFFAIGFSVLIGVVSGIIPAHRASKLQPVEALRYE